MKNKPKIGKFVFPPNTPSKTIQLPLNGIADSPHSKLKWHSPMSTTTLTGKPLNDVDPVASTGVGLPPKIFCMPDLESGWWTRPFEGRKQHELLLLVSWKSGGCIVRMADRSGAELAQRCRFGGRNRPPGGERALAPVYAVRLSRTTDIVYLANYRQSTWVDGKLLSWNGLFLFCVHCSWVILLGKMYDVVRVIIP